MEHQSDMQCLTSTSVAHSTLLIEQLLGSLAVGSWERMALAACGLSSPGLTVAEVFVYTWATTTELRINFVFRSFVCVAYDRLSCS